MGVVFVHQLQPNEAGFQDAPAQRPHRECVDGVWFLWRRFVCGGGLVWSEGGMFSEGAWFGGGFVGRGLGLEAVLSWGWVGWEVACWRWHVLEGAWLGRMTWLGGGLGLRVSWLGLKGGLFWRELGVDCGLVCGGGLVWSRPGLE